MNPELFDRALRQGIEAWEREAAAYWDTLTRSPDFLRRVGQQITDSLEAYQRIMATLHAGVQRSAAVDRQAAHTAYLLARLEKQVQALAERLDRLEARLDDA